MVSHSTVVQEVPGSNPGAAEKCWTVMELFVNIYLYEFVLSLLCSKIFFSGGGGFECPRSAFFTYKFLMY